MLEDLFIYKLKVSDNEFTALANFGNSKAREVEGTFDIKNDRVEIASMYVYNGSGWHFLVKNNSTFDFAELEECIEMRLPKYDERDDTDKEYEKLVDRYLLDDNQTVNETV